jgi:signal transduction histidine kinase
MGKVSKVTDDFPQGVDSGGSAAPRLLRDYWWLATLGMVVSLAVTAAFESTPLLCVGSPLFWLAGVGMPVLAAGFLWSRSRIRQAAEALAGGSLSPLVSLPGRLAAMHLVAWLTIGAAVGVILWLGARFRPDRSFLVILACGLAGAGTALAARVRAAILLMPDLAAFHVGSSSAVSMRATLRRRLTLVLGGLVFFSSAFGLTMVFALQREIVAYYVDQQREEFVRAASSALATKPADPCAALEPLVPVDGAVYGLDEELECQLGVTLEEPLEELLKSARPGPLSLPAADLEGALVALGSDGSGPHLAFLLPRPEWTRRVLLVSLLFYTLLFMFSAYLAAQVARSLTTPIDALRRQLARIAKGDLKAPVGLTSTDEIGQLAQSAEAMRHGLEEMVETIQALNLNLEEKVQERTLQLEDANHGLRDALQQLKETQSHLVHAEKMASLGRLMTGLAHELNNPVNAILNTVGPLQKTLEGLSGTVAEERLDRLIRAGRVVSHAARRTVDLIESMGTFSRAGEQVSKPTDLNNAICATWLLLQHRVDDGKSVVENVAGELPMVEVVPGEISQVFMNLFANALDAVASKGRDGLVRVTTDAQPDGVAVTVEDNGVGVPVELRPRIFEPFFTTKDSGTGLGLSISHEVVDRHHGSLEVDDSPLGGARFTLRLPLE